MSTLIFQFFYFILQPYNQRAIVITSSPMVSAGLALALGIHKAFNLLQRHLIFHCISLTHWD